MLGASYTKIRSQHMEFHVILICFSKVKVAYFIKYILIISELNNVIYVIAAKIIIEFFLERHQMQAFRIESDG